MFKSATMLPSIHGRMRREIARTEQALFLYP